MSESRNQMIDALKRTVVPVLRARGFRGSFPHFRRLGTDRVDLLTFQFDKWGGGFVVEIAKCPPQGYTTPWGTEIAPTKVTAHDVNRRLRLGATREDADHWFRFDDERLGSQGAVHDVVAQELLPLLDAQAEIWWRDA